MHLSFQTHQLHLSGTLKTELYRSSKQLSVTVVFKQCFMLIVIDLDGSCRWFSLPTCSILYSSFDNPRLAADEGAQAGHHGQVDYRYYC